MSVSSSGNLHTTMFGDLDLNNSGEVLKTSGATLFATYVDNSANSDDDCFECIYDTASAPTVGTTNPVEVSKVGPGKKMTFVRLGYVGIALASGIAIAGKTTGGTGGSTSPTNDAIGKVWTN